MTAPPQPPALRELRRVVPVGRVEEQGGWAITCLAAECYDDGIRVTFRVFHAGLWPCHPELALVVGDDRGGRYHHWGGGGNGAGNWGNCDWRVAYNCTPELDPQARELRLSIAAVQLLALNESGQRLVATESHPGSWEFVVPL